MRTAHSLSTTGEVLPLLGACCSELCSGAWEQELTLLEQSPALRAVSSDPLKVAHCCCARSSQDADRACNSLNSRELHGRKLKVEKAMSSE